MPGEVKSDAELALNLLAGDEDAFTQFVKAFHARLSQYSFLMCGHREDAEEVAQETLLKVFESIDQLRDPSRLKSWVFRIAKNECFMKRRKSVFAPKVELSLDDLRPRVSEGEMPGIELADWTSLPEDLLLDTELRYALTRSIQELPEIYRSVVLLRDVEELTTEETAEILDIRPDAVKMRLHRGRLALRQYMDHYLRTATGGRQGMNDSDCGRVFALLSEYLDRELAPATCQELEEHLRGCPQCIQFVQSLKRSVQLCHDYGDCRTAPPVAPEVMAGFRRAYEKMLAKRRGSHENAPQA